MTFEYGLRLIPQTRITMKFKIEISNIKTVKELHSYWSISDYQNLLKEFDMFDASVTDEQELKELLFMAISDLDPDDSAAIVLTYKLSKFLSKGQIDTLAIEMQNDAVCEEYADISLHETLFHINQLLYKAYNGKFPISKVSIIDFSINLLGKNDNKIIDKELVLRSFYSGLSERSLIHRLFHGQLESEKPFKEANSIIWGLKERSPNIYQLITSDYWLNEEDFETMTFEGIVKMD